MGRKKAPAPCMVLMPVKLQVAGEEGAETTHLYISAGKKGTSVRFILFRKDPVVENERGSAFEGAGLIS